MAEFEVKVVEISDVQEHPNADRLTIIRVGGYTCIANKHDDGSWRYHAGDLVVYIPENALVPEWLLRRQGMWNDEKGVGFLAGSKGNRVKAIRLRGIFSEGILFPVVMAYDALANTMVGMIDGDVHSVKPDGHVINHARTVSIGDDVSEFLGVTKYEPVIPESMSGEVFNLGFAPIKFDLEPIEKHLDLFLDGELVVVTEKLHGTFTGISIIPGLDHEDAFPLPSGSKDVVVWSKGLGAKGLVFKNSDANVSNLYTNVWKNWFTANEDFWNWYYNVVIDLVPTGSSIHIMGETYGAGVQDLAYGATGKEFRIFAIAIVTPERRVEWVMPRAVVDYANEFGVPAVPVLYEGPYDFDVVVSHRDGKTTLGGEHIREGVVVNSAASRMVPEFGVVRVKAVSPDYKLRKGGTEYN